MKRSRVGAIGLVAIGLLVGAACGGGGDDDQDKVVEAATDVFQSMFDGDIDHVLASVTPCEAVERQALIALVPVIADEKNGKGQVVGVDVVSIAGDAASVRIRAERGGTALPDSPEMNLQKIDGEWHVSCASLANE